MIQRIYRGGLITLLVFAFRTFSLGQEEKHFGMKGITEIGGTIALQSLTPVYDGESGDGFGTFNASGYVGFFPTDGFELGFNPVGILGS